MKEPSPNALRHIPYMGVIYVVAEAMKLGFWNGHPDWCNLGQGQPEVGEIEGAPPRISEIQMTPTDHAYGPIAGTDDLRQAVADHYNRLYREDKQSKYSAANVCIASGGRLMLSRLFASLGDVRLGYQTPDYTAYEDMIGYHQHRLTPIELAASESDGFRIPANELRNRVDRLGIEAFVLSNPCNPTGTVIRGEELSNYVAISRDTGMTLVLDEFYSHFIYESDGSAGMGPVSAAAYVEDVENEPVLLIDGLTKSFRYPGWRVGWAVGPAAMIDTLGRAASAIDGGPGQPIQRAALEVLKPERADAESSALRQVFARKRNLMTRRLAEMGIQCCPEPQGTFYCWASLRDLPPPLNDGQAFFEEALKYKVMTVPGRFFDVNPGGLRVGPSPFQSWTRFSFGPPEENVREGLDRLERMIATIAQVT
ncbi:MAG TPA: pyridoxal phosphate-dependent aminotransferase [Pyrinomonadaceae bacterium]